MYTLHAEGRRRRDGVRKSGSELRESGGDGFTGENRDPFFFFHRVNVGGIPRGSDNTSTGYFSNVEYSKRAELREGSGLPEKRRRRQQQQEEAALRSSAARQPPSETTLDRSVSQCGISRLSSYL